jgi:preprotein translocase subunit SecY
MIKKYHEGKTLGSVLHGLVYAPGYALLVIFISMMRRKIPVNALGTLRITGILSLQVLNAAKDWVRPGTELKSRG